MRCRSLLALSLCLLSLAAAAQTYRWTDANGRTVYSDSPPPGKAKNLQSIETAPPAPDADLPFATRQAATNFPVVLYTAENCTDVCRQARELLAGRGVPYTEKVIKTQEDGNELKQLVGEIGLPTLKVGRQPIRGFLAPAYNDLLDFAGYPKKSAPAPEGGR